MAAHEYRAASLPREEEFPVGGTPAEKLRFLLGYAVFAPSGHNTQPWQFRIDGGHVDLYADWSRILPVLDPQGRELVMSCGAALFHLRVAIRHVGYAPRVDILPDQENPALLARVHLGETSPPTAEDQRLFRAIPRRHTNWLSFETRPLPPGLLEELGTAARAEGARLVPLEPDRRPLLRGLNHEADLRLARSRSFRTEMAGWLGGERAGRGGGMPGYPVEVGEQVAYAGPLASTTEPGAVLAAQTGRLLEQVPQVALLGTEQEGVADWIAAGQALDHVLLLAASEGVSACYLNGPLQVEALRPKVSELLGVPGALHCVLGLGYAPRGRSTPRRPVEDVLLA
jgi:Nitroreductase family.